MSYEDYKKMMIKDIKDDPEWYFDLIELKNKELTELMLSASKKIPEEQLDIIHNHYNSLLDEYQDELDRKFMDEEAVSIPQLQKDQIALITKLAYHKVGMKAEEILTNTQYEVYKHHMDGSSPEEIANILGKDVSGIYKIINRCSEKMKKAIDDEIAPKMSTIKKEFSRL